MDNKHTALTLFTGTGYRAARIDLDTSEAEYLEPLPGDQHTWAQGMNRSGSVVCYSFNFNAVERIGIWRPSGRFEVYLEQGPPIDNILSNRLLINDSNLIVITLTFQGVSFIVPKKGLRLSIADLVVNAPVNLRIDYVEEVNNQGDMVATNFVTGGQFLLRRVGANGN